MTSKHDVFVVEKASSHYAQLRAFFRLYWFIGQGFLNKALGLPSEHLVMPILAAAVQLHIAGWPSWLSGVTEADGE